ncbi:hypothetical protein Pmani_002306 [Petrolisthes manimaculis]|uniref:Uncharacterized protein n=1 Tax=Petrolisthes manimaculis TaxID=1843537 RepID=A0AAE1QI94_9EUCA|nr:hypothetical protein Pmani_002306 [Petrolisthes manimaculis]
MLRILLWNIFGLRSNTNSLKEAVDIVMSEEIVGDIRSIPQELLVKPTPCGEGVEVLAIKFCTGSTDL